MELWMYSGSQELYGPGPLKEVAKNAAEVARGLDAAKVNPHKIVFKSVLTTPEGIRAAVQEANGSSECIGVILWMHTFSPSQNVDCRAPAAAATDSAPPHPVRPRHPLGLD
jgi:L-arabinose isomerase